ncbi:MAG: hypothetical protein J6T06_09185 [Victivallales bacterium]|nr:hypothetical protein [Victivallales bacterium]
MIGSMMTGMVQSKGFASSAMDNRGHDRIKSNSAMNRFHLRAMREDIPVLIFIVFPYMPFSLFFRWT